MHSLFPARGWIRCDGFCTTTLNVLTLLVEFTRLNFAIVGVAHRRILNVTAAERIGASMLMRSRFLFRLPVLSATIREGFQ